MVIEQLYSTKPAVWNPPARRVKKVRRTPTRQTVENLKPGDCVEIHHGDVCCKRYGSCSLTSFLSQKRRLGWDVEIYHTGEAIAVVRRLK